MPKSSRSTLWASLASVLIALVVLAQVVEAADHASGMSLDRRLNHTRRRAKRQLNLALDLDDLDIEVSNDGLMLLDFPPPSSSSTTTVLEGTSLAPSSVESTSNSAKSTLAPSTTETSTSETTAVESTSPVGISSSSSSSDSVMSSESPVPSAESTTSAETTAAIESTQESVGSSERSTDAPSPSASTAESTSSSQEAQLVPASSADPSPVATSSDEPSATTASTTSPADLNPVISTLDQQASPITVTTSSAETPSNKTEIPAVSSSDTPSDVTSANPSMPLAPSLLINITTVVPTSVPLTMQVSGVDTSIVSAQPVTAVSVVSTPIALPSMTIHNSQTQQAVAEYPAPPYTSNTTAQVGMASTLSSSTFSATALHGIIIPSSTNSSSLSTGAERSASLSMLPNAVNANTTIPSVLSPAGSGTSATYRGATPTSPRDQTASTYPTVVETGSGVDSTQSVRLSMKATMTVSQSIAVTTLTEGSPNATLSSASSTVPSQAGSSFTKSASTVFIIATLSSGAINNGTASQTQDANSTAQGSQDTPLLTAVYTTIATLTNHMSSTTIASIPSTALPSVPGQDMDPFENATNVLSKPVSMAHATLSSSDATFVLSSSFSYTITLSSPSVPIPTLLSPSPPLNTSSSSSIPFSTKTSIADTRNSTSTAVEPSSTEASSDITSIVTTEAVGVPTVTSDAPATPTAESSTNLSQNTNAGTQDSTITVEQSSTGEVPTQAAETATASAAGPADTATASQPENVPSSSIAPPESPTTDVPPSTLAPTSTEEPPPVDTVTDAATSEAVPATSTLLNTDPSPIETPPSTAPATTEDPITTTTAAQSSDPVFNPVTTTEDASPTTTPAQEPTDQVTQPTTTEPPQTTDPATQPSAEPQPSQPSPSAEPTGQPTVTDPVSESGPTASPSQEASATEVGPDPSGTFSGTIRPTTALESSGGSDDSSVVATVSTTSTPVTESGVPADAISSIISVTGTPDVNGSGVITFQPTSTTDWDSEFTSSSTVATSSGLSWSDEAYTPTQTWLIGATNTATASETWSEDDSSFETAAPTGTKTTGTTSVPSVATIPSSMPTLIVPANSVANNADAGTGTEKDPIQDSTLIAILLASDYYPWWFVVNSSDATSQLFNTFPTLLGGALTIGTDQVQTYGLQVYQPASWDGQEATLLTQYMAYIPTQYFDTLNSYIKTASSPLYNQPGIEGALAAQINTAFPLAASSDSAPTSQGTTSGSSSGNRKRNIIIGVCVGLGGALWIGLIYWIYMRVKKSNDKAVHKRLSEHMSMFGDHRPMSEVYAASGWRDEQRPVSIAASEIDDRPSSFYASPFENDRSMREQQRMDRGSYGGSHSAYSRGSGDSPTTGTYGPSVFGTSWFQNPHQPQGAPRQRASQNPFEDMARRSYLGTSTGYNAKRGSAAGKPVSKAIISQPTLQANSLEFRDYGSFQ
ncbi:hypothetical protein IAU60_001288 [Kwoniella sp. DSM 27419]